MQAITSAKGPIIKFTYCRSRLEGDISLYNVLAQENTDMLRFYANIELADDLAAAGAQEITLGLNGPDYDLGPVAEWIAWAQG